MNKSKITSIFKESISQCLYLYNISKIQSLLAASTAAILFHLPISSVAGLLLRALAFQPVLRVAARGNLVISAQNIAASHLRARPCS